MKTHVLSHMCCIENNAFYKIITRNMTGTVRPMKYLMMIRTYVVP